MRAMDAGLLAFLNSAKQIVPVDVFSFELKNGTVLRYSNAGVVITYGGVTWQPAPAGLTRSRVRWAQGVEVDTLNIVFQADSSIKVGPTSVPMLAAAVQGAFDNCRVTLSRLFFPNLTSAAVGKLDLFQGNTAPAEIVRNSLHLTVKSDLDRLNVMFPPNVFQASCMHTLYDIGCTVNPATYRVASSVISVNPDGSINTALAQADGYFQTGSVKVTSGANAGLTRTVKTFTGGKLWLSQPFPYAFTAGDALVVTPGCDHRQNGDCSARYNNIIHFKATPFIPVPETAA